MNSTKADKSSGVRSYGTVRPPANQTPGSRAVGSKGSGMQARTPATEGRGSFSGSPPAMSASCDWGSPHKVPRTTSTGRGK